MTFRVAFLGNGFMPGRPKERKVRYQYISLGVYTFLKIFNISRSLCFWTRAFRSKAKARESLASAGGGAKTRSNISYFSLMLL